MELIINTLKTLPHLRSINLKGNKFEELSENDQVELAGIFIDSRIAIEVNGSFAERLQGLRETKSLLANNTPLLDAIGNVIYEHIYSFRPR